MAKTVFLIFSLILSLTAYVGVRADNSSGRYSTAYAYDLNGNITSLTRSGLYDNSPRRPLYGLIEDLTMDYDGNRVACGCILIIL